MAGTQKKGRAEDEKKRKKLQLSSLSETMRKYDLRFDDLEKIEKISFEDLIYFKMRVIRKEMNLYDYTLKNFSSIFFDAYLSGFLKFLLVETNMTFMNIEKMTNMSTEEIRAYIDFVLGESGRVKFSSSDKNH